MTLRRDLIANHGNKVHGCVPGGEAAVQELYTYLLTEHLPIRFPSLFKLSSDKSLFTNAVTGKTFPTVPTGDADAALRVIGETIEEDVFLLQPSPEGHRSVAFMCCFPSGFDPSSKLGRTLIEIHSPVPAYEKIGASMERFFGKLEVGKSVKRTNVSYPYPIRDCGDADRLGCSGRCKLTLSCSTAARTTLRATTSTRPTKRSTSQRCAFSS